MKQGVFPPLLSSEWKETRERLHKYCRLVGAIREVLSRPLPNSLHTNLLLCRRGFTTSPIPREDVSAEQTFEVIIEMNRARLSIESNYREPLHIALTGQSLNALCDETCSLLTDIGIKPPLERPSFLEGTRGRFERKHIKAYWQSVKSAEKILNKIMSGLEGDAGPIQLHVDSLNLSFTWYCKEFYREATIDEIEFGLSTGDERFPEAHFYVHSFPDIRAIKNVLPVRCRRYIINDGSKMILPYSEVSGSHSGEMQIINFFNCVLS